MNSARPISPEEYKKLLAELYKDGATSYKVDLDADPAANPRVVNQKLQMVQAYKNRVVTILNQAVANEAYWNVVVKKLDARYEAAVSQAMVGEAVKAEKNAESRKASADIAAGRKVVETLFQGKGDYADHYVTALGNQADARSFLAEVENIYKNLDSTDMNLAVQQKNILLCVRLRGDANAAEDLEAREEVRATELAIG